MAACWPAKEALRWVYAAPGIGAAQVALAAFYRWCDGLHIAELDRLARTIRRRERAILAFHTTGGTSNGTTEGLNLLVKRIKLIGFSFRNLPTTAPAAVALRGHVADSSDREVARHLTTFRG